MVAKKANGEAHKRGIPYRYTVLYHVLRLYLGATRHTGRRRSARPSGRHGSAASWFESRNAAPARDAKSAARPSRYSGRPDIWYSHRTVIPRWLQLLPCGARERSHTLDRWCCWRSVL